VLLHRFSLIACDYLVHEIDPLLCRKVLHLFPPNFFLCLSAPQR
jgi:hypothetical protein